MLSIVSADKRESILKLRFPADQLLSLCAEVLVRFLACSKYDTKNRDLSFAANGYGKPYLQHHPDFHFNISHTRSAVAVASSDGEIGVDIERISAANIKISEQFFAPAERDFVLQSADKDRAFYQIWTIKEAYIKQLGKGLSVPLTSFNVLDDEIRILTQTVEKSGYIISICSSTPHMDSSMDSHAAPYIAPHTASLVDVQHTQFGDRLKDFLNAI
jgi:4'-phosphopantetheinyl transferase